MTKKSFLLILPLIFLLSCSTKHEKKINDLIPFINVAFGETDSLFIGDLFFSESYEGISFNETPYFDLKFEASSGLLVITPTKNFTGVKLINFTYRNVGYAIPVRSNYREKFTFSYKPDKEYKNLTIFGTFNSWNRLQHFMSDEDKDGIYSVDLMLVPGRYEYKIYGDGQEIVDPGNKNVSPNGMGSFNNVLIVEDMKSDIDNFLYLDVYKKEDGQKITFFSPSSGKDEIIALFNNEPVPGDKIGINGDRITIDLTGDDMRGENILRVVRNIPGGATNTQIIAFYNGEPAGKSEEINSWFDGIIYSLMIDRFNDGDESLNQPIIHDSLFKQANYQGGDLSGIINKIDDNYFTDLGINTLWISPVYDNPSIAFQEYPEPHRWYSGYHGYWPVHYQRVEEHFGTMENLKLLVKKAHGKKIRVLLDFVSNHVHKDHPFFVNHRDWFGVLDLPGGRKNIRFWDEYRLTTWFEPYLPSFDYLGSKAALEIMTDNAVWWLNETGADGFRHDAVKHVPNEFWRKLTFKLKSNIEERQGKKLYQIGETFGGYDLISSYVNNGQLSAQFNFNLYDVARMVFLKNDESFESLSKEMKKTFSVYGELHLMGNIMDSHDKVRYMAYTDGDIDPGKWDASAEAWSNPPQVEDPLSYKKAGIYLAYMMSIPGLPVIYYGSEFGMTGASDPDNRRMMRFGSDLSSDEQAMLEATKKLTALRNSNSALRYGDFYTLFADNSVFAYVRSDLNQRVLIVLNKNSESKTVNLKLPALFAAVQAADLEGGETISVTDNSIPVTIPGYSWKMFELNK